MNLKMSKEISHKVGAKNIKHTEKDWYPFFK